VVLSAADERWIPALFSALDVDSRFHHRQASLTWVTWIERVGNGLTPELVEQARASGSFFARKVLRLADLLAFYAQLNVKYSLL
jgi:hypothetical protein